MVDLVQAQAQRVRHIETHLPAHLPTVRPSALAAVNGAKVGMNAKNQ